jgi:DNA-binding protein HU-beta
MTKAELIAMIAEKAGLTKVQAESAFSATFETITELMKKQEKVMIAGFGGFSTKVRAERKGRNPSSGKEIIIPQAIVASFKPATQLKETINDQAQ